MTTPQNDYLQIITTKLTSNTNQMLMYKFQKESRAFILELSPDNGDKHIKAMGYILVYWNQEKNVESLFKCYDWIQKDLVINKKAYFENLKCNEHSKKTLIT